ncbi:MAG TPA: amidase family protein, partial [Xanthobacteraceae bacterium]|nr:amidase family protein [Xanthobacteraceae bacterium]
MIDATLARIRAINPKLNAIVTLDEAGAISAAEASARRWKDGHPLGTLDGVPVTIKDNILAAGLRATWGSRLYENFVPDEDELPVRRLREAGAVILGKTNVPEFTVHGFTHNAVFG